MERQCFSSLKNQKKEFLNFYKMETQKIIDLLNDSNNEKSKFVTKKQYLIGIHTTKDKNNQNNSIKFERESIKSNICDYSGAFILVTGDIAVTVHRDTDFAFKNCVLFSTCKTELNDVFIDKANLIYTAQPMHNLI